MNVWTTLLAVEGQLSTDRRLIEPGAIEWDPDAEIPFLLYRQAHDGLVRVGTIVTVRRESPYVVGDIAFDLTTDVGTRCAEQAANDEPLPVAVDLDILDVKMRGDELRIAWARLRAATIVPVSAFPQCRVLRESAA